MSTCSSDAVVASGGGLRFSQGFESMRGVEWECGVYQQVRRAHAGSQSQKVGRRGRVVCASSQIPHDGCIDNNIPYPINDMSRPNAPRSLTLPEELEKLEQSITLTLQEIDSNFSKAHRIVTSTILPIVEQYGKHSGDVWEGSKFWKR